MQLDQQPIAGSRLQWRSRRAVRPGGGILDELYVIIFLNYFEHLLLGYIAYLLIVNHILLCCLAPRRRVAEMGPAISFTL